MSPPRPVGLELECDTSGCKARATVLLQRNGRPYCRPHGLADALRLVNGHRSGIEPLGEPVAWLIYGTAAAPAPSALHRRRASEQRTVCGLEPPAPSLLYQEAQEAAKRCGRCFAPARPRRPRAARQTPPEASQTVSVRPVREHGCQ